MTDNNSYQTQEADAADERQRKAHAEMGKFAARRSTGCSLKAGNWTTARIFLLIGFIAATTAVCASGCDYL
jgi:hypothetical protein